MEKKRTYRSESRKAQATQTRAKILSAAKALFQDDGLDSVTIEQLAQAADVSAPTIYALFQSKRGVLRALLDEAMPPNQHSALVEKGMKEPSAKKQLALTAKLTRKLYDAERAQMDLFRGAAMVAPEFRELERERELRRYDRQEEFMRLLAKHKMLAKGLTLVKARDILWAFTGRDLYRLCVVERGWTSAAFEKWLAQLLVQTLLRPDAP